MRGSFSSCKLQSNSKFKHTTPAAIIITYEIFQDFKQPAISAAIFRYSLFGELPLVEIGHYSWLQPAISGYSFRYQHFRILAAKCHSPLFKTLIYMHGGYHILYQWLNYNVSIDYTSDYTNMPFNCHISPHLSQCTPQFFFLVWIKTETLYYLPQSYFNSWSHCLQLFHLHCSWHPISICFRQDNFWSSSLLSKIKLVARITMEKDNEPRSLLATSSLMSLCLGELICLEQTFMDCLE